MPDRNYCVARDTRIDRTWGFMLLDDMGIGERDGHCQAPRYRPVSVFLGLFLLWSLQPFQLVGWRFERGASGAP